MPEPICVGFLGAGLIATFHSKLIRRSGLEVVRAGVFDPDRGRAEAFAQASGHRVCGSNAGGERESVTRATN